MALPGDRTLSYQCRVRGLATPEGVSVGPWSALVPVLLTVPSLTSVVYDDAVATVALTWQPDLGAFVAVLFEGAAELASASGAGAEAAIRVTLRPGGAYSARVRATAPGSLGPWSPPVVVLPTAPDGLLAGTIGSDVAATWHPLTAATEYEVELHTLQGGLGKVVTGPPATFQPVVAGVDYTVRVRARKDAISHGPWTAPVPGPFLRTGTLEHDGLGVRPLPPRVQRDDCASDARQPARGRDDDLCL